MCNQGGDLCNEYTLNVEGDVSNWEIGDRLMLTSTDYDMDQAEEVKVKEKPTMSEVKVEGE